MAAILLSSAYNHYLSAYASKEVTQSDSHKKEDLRNIYKSIVKSTLKAPTRLSTRDERAEEGAIDLKENARRLEYTLGSLGDISKDKALSSRSAFSSDEDVVSAVYIGDASEAPPSFTVSVNQLANEQVNTGTFTPKGEVELPAGPYAFNIRMDSQVYELQYSIKSGETNRDVQERLARLINKAGIGLKATISTGEDSSSSLVLSSTTTGLKGKQKQFDITEESESGSKGTVAYFGLDHVTKEAKDAVFKINGSTRTSTSNHFTVSKTYELNLNSVSESGKETLIGVKDKQESMIDHVRTLVSSYNDFLDAMKSIGSQKVRTGKITAETIRSAKGTLDESRTPVGVFVADDGHLGVNEAELQAASEISADELDEKLQPVRDFAGKLLSISKDIALDPMQYVDRPIVAYKNPHAIATVNPYVTSEYSGMLFNSYC